MVSAIAKFDSGRRVTVLHVEATLAQAVGDKMDGCTLTRRIGHATYGARLLSPAPALQARRHS